MPQDHQQAVWDEAYRYRKNSYTRLVSEGDSWFCYPMWRSMLDFVSESNKFALCRRGESGRLLKQIVHDGKYLKAVKSEKPEALLISGSGNDFVNKKFVTGGDGGPMFDRYVEGMSVDDVINAPKWESKLDELAGYFETIIKRVGSLPVITHGYDYILPNGKPAAYNGIDVAGPWIQPTLKIQLVPETMHRDIVRLMIDSLNTMMAGLAATHSTFIHADVRQRTVDADWANEIHPYESGFQAIAREYLRVVNKVLA